MRNIKFRGKTNAYPSRWVHGYLANKKYINEYDNGDFYFTSIKEETIGQYTGLKDQKGKEIFEGDVVYIIPLDERGIIRWDTEMARYVVIYNNIITDFDNWYGKDLEVIGNKWDNPELLEKGE